MTAILFWILTGAASALALLSLRGERARSRYARERLRAAPGFRPAATVIVPVKGEDDGLRENLAALASLDYPDYELIVVARTASDIPGGVLPPRVKVVLANGPEGATSEKVRNLAAAVRAARKPSDVLAFADSDGRVPPGWLNALAAPLIEPGVGAATGYRWYAPCQARFATLLRSAWNAVIAGGFGPGDNRFAWGGSMAIRKETFLQLRVFDYWKGVVSDDYALSAAVHAAGLRVAWAPGATVRCEDSTGIGALVEWTRRQLAITRCYAPSLWWMALVAHVVYCGAMAACVAAAVAGRPAALLGLAPVVLPGMAKGWRRAALAREMAPGPGIAPAVHALLVPAATWLWLVSLVLSAVGSGIVWRGVTYELRRPAWAVRQARRRT